MATALRFESVYDAENASVREVKRANLNVVEGSKKRNWRDALADNSKVVIGTVATGLIIAVVLCIMTVSFKVATVSSLAASQSLRASIDQSVSDASELEVQLAVFSNPTRIADIATGSLGMVPAQAVASMDVPGADGSSVVATSSTTTVN